MLRAGLTRHPKSPWGRKCMISRQLSVYFQSIFHEQSPLFVLLLRFSYYNTIAMHWYVNWHKAITYVYSLRISAVISFYFIISLSMVFLNKYVLDNLQFPYPLLMTWLQFVVAIVCIIVFGYLGKKGYVHIQSPPYTLVLSAISLLLLMDSCTIFSIIPPWEFDWSIAQRVLPLTVIYLCMIVFNNLCLQYVQVSFYQVRISIFLNYELV